MAGKKVNLEVRFSKCGRILKGPGVYDSFLINMRIRSFVLLDLDGVIEPSLQSNCLSTLPHEKLAALAPSFPSILSQSNQKKTDEIKTIKPAVKGEPAI